ncbi:Thiaminase-2 [Legionella massiliensis]|uniref:Thiaminase-2 n=1 Tax=Legionella massiliensis TaxID=1034943 RepID=A0A078KNR5_9GAMM|nr:TenA family protein [Legionella massiliensis]CDZ75975.1 Thiaminase-2 [Legionella massiliensis]CEE11713.1 Thiaminase-2 [Legionella massiliensis]
MKLFALIQKNPSVFSKIYTCRFNRKLYKGTLSKSVFRSYLEQDELYLSDYGKALNLVSSRLVNQRHAQIFRDFAKGTIQLEKDIHAKYLKKLAPDSFFSTERRPKEKIPVIAEYTKHLLDNAEFAPIEEAVASLVPCFWIYKELGIQMDLSKCEPGHPYREWIATYADEQFRESTQTMMEIADELNVEILCPDRRSSIARQFWLSVDFEYRFFEEILNPLPVADLPFEVSVEQRM